MSEEVRSLQRQLDQMRSQMQRLESVSRNVWQYSGVVKTGAPYVLVVGRGNTIATIGAILYKGLKYPSADVTTAPSAAPAAIDTPSPDGISPAYLVSETGNNLVWIGTRLKPGTEAAVTEMTGSFFDGSPVICHNIISMPISGAPTTFAAVYVPFRL